MIQWYSGFCTGLAALILLALLICVCAAVYHSGTISQAQEEQEP